MSWLSEFVDSLNQGSGTICGAVSHSVDYGQTWSDPTLTPYGYSFLTGAEWGGTGGSASSSDAANNAARLAVIIKQLQKCPQYSQVGNELAQMSAQGRITTAPNQGPYGWYHPLSDKITLSPDAMENDPLAPIHELAHRHQTANVGGKWWQPFGAFNMQIGAAWGGMDKVWDQHVKGRILSQGFVENVAQAYAEKVASTCGIK